MRTTRWKGWTTAVLAGASLIASTVITANLPADIERDGERSALRCGAPDDSKAVASVRCTTGLANTRVWVEVELKGASVAGQAFHATAGGGESLAVRIVRSAAGAVQLELKALGSDPMFEWIAGLPLSIRMVGGRPGPFTVGDWVLHPAGQPELSKRAEQLAEKKAGRLRVWSYALLLVSLLSPLALLIPQKVDPPPSLTPSILIVALIEQITGSNDHETTVKRQMLVAVLNGASSDEVLLLAGNDRERAQSLFFEASRDLESRIHLYAQYLKMYEGELRPGSPPALHD